MPTACLLDLPSPTVDPGFEASIPDTGLPDGYVPPDGNMMMTDGGGSDAGMDGVSVLDGGGCDGPCVFATFSNVEPHHIDNDNASVFYAVGADVIEARTISTKAVTTLVTSGGNDVITDLKLRGNYVYFASAGARASRVPKGGGQRNNYTTTGSGLQGIDADSLYAWFTVGTGIVRCARDTPFPCTTLNPIHAHTSPKHILVDGTFVYWDNANPALFFCSGNCGSETATMQFGDQDFTFDGNTVYWVDKANVLKMPKGQTSMMYFADGAHGATNGFAIRSDGTNVYWLTKSGTNDGALRRCAIASGCTSKNADTLASNLANPTSLTITSNEVFFTTQGDDTVWRVPK